MDDYTREMMDLKTLVTRTLEKKGVLAKIRAELRASVFEAIEEEDKVTENDDGVPPALLGSCNERAKQLHASPSGRLLTALIADYLDWAQLNHSLKVYLPECNLEYSQARGSGRRSMTPDSESLSNLDPRNVRRTSSSSSSVSGGLPSLERMFPASHMPDRRGGSSMPGNRKDEYNWRYDSDEMSEDVIRASHALENIQLDRKAQNLSTSWRHGGDETSEDDSKSDRI